ncbi:N-acetyltransferase [Helicobacter sp. MIT 14-3879]|uniref:GNAT family N-acetyltransferase n=1 Tax=Helicobacter sp. MIT 14-3879 TaxID=2040649 RepID=UPI000E1E7C73|nr:GNAT family N-acetyltransferase [Helicobacter sp. MIT 14-3879]RDU64784.1 hypothetical protein CQA44_03475 [Helicobacter sp. MIT 14-3879]
MIKNIDFKDSNIAKSKIFIKDSKKYTLSLSKYDDTTKIFLSHNVAQTSLSTIFLHHIDQNLTSIATEFVNIVEKELARHNVHTIDLFVSTNNLRAINFYNKLGFKEQRKILKKEF